MSRIGRASLSLASLAVGGLSALTYSRYQQDIRQARARISTGSEVLETSRGIVEYAAAGDGAPLLVVHGAGGGYDQGLDFGRGLIPHRFRVIAMSRFGYLRTPLPADPSPAAQADAHAALLDALQIHRVAVIGASAGAPSAMQFALRYPQRCSALVLVVPVTYVPRPNGRTVTPFGTEFLFSTALKSDFLFWAAIKYASPFVIRAVLATPPEIVDSASAAERSRVMQILNHILPVRPRRLGLLTDAAVTSSLPRYELEKLLAPTLVVSAADDLFGTYDCACYTASHIPNARFLGFRSGGHTWVGHHNELLQEISGFLPHRPAH